MYLSPFTIQLFIHSHFSLVTEKSLKAAAAAASSGPGLVEESKAIGFIEAFMLPNVMSYAIAFGFFKLVNYAMFFQLPFILSANFSPATSNIISIFYSLGMMPGGIVCGWVSDLYGGRRYTLYTRYARYILYTLYTRYIRYTL